MPPELSFYFLSTKHCDVSIPDINVSQIEVGRVLERTGLVSSSSSLLTSNFFSGSLSFSQQIFTEPPLSVRSCAGHCGAARMF